MIRVVLLLLLSACLAGPASAAAGRDASPATVQVLLMLRAPAPHYRPDTAYANAYQAPGRTARRALAGRLAAAQGLGLHEDWAMPLLGLDCFVLDAPDDAAAARAVAALGRDPRVDSVQRLQRFRLLAGTGDNDPLYPAQPAAARWHLAELHRHATGAGVRVAVIDTAVAAHHPDLEGQVAEQRDFVDGDHADAEAHGTAVAGVIAARAGNGIGIAGVAPQARLLALRACWQRSATLSECNSFTLAKALQFAIERRARIINLSLSGPPDPLLARLLDVALDRGAIVVAAFDPQQRDGGFPASHPGVLAATAVPLVHASGALWVPGTRIPAPAPDGRWTLVDGASFAAAQLSGLAALAKGRAPAVRGVQLRAWMSRTAAVDACAVLAQAENACVCNCSIASATMAPPHR